MERKKKTKSRLLDHHFQNIALLESGKVCFAGETVPENIIVRETAKGLPAVDAVSGHGTEGGIPMAIPKTENEPKNSGGIVAGNCTAERFFAVRDVPKESADNDIEKVLLEVEGEHNTGEKQLILQAREGDTESMEMLIQRYLPLVRIRASSFAKSGPDVQDLTQEGLLGLLSAIQAYRPEKGVRFSVFAEVCVNNRMKNHLISYNSDKNAPMRDFCSLDEHPALAAEHSRFDPESVYIAQERRHIFTELQGRLTAVELRVWRGYINGESYDVMAKAMGRSRKTVDNAMQRIRKKLRKLQQEST